MSPPSRNDIPPRPFFFYHTDDLSSRRSEICSLMYGVFFMSSVLHQRLFWKTLTPSLPCRLAFFLLPTLNFNVDQSLPGFPPYCLLPLRCPNGLPWAVPSVFPVADSATPLIGYLHFFIAEPVLYHAVGASPRWLSLRRSFSFPNLCFFLCPFHGPSLCYPIFLETPAAKQRSLVLQDLVAPPVPLSFFSLFRLRPRLPFIYRRRSRFLPPDCLYFFPTTLTFSDVLPWTLTCLLFPPHLPCT